MASNKGTIMFFLFSSDSGDNNNNKSRSLCVYCHPRNLYAIVIILAHSNCLDNYNSYTLAPAHIVFNFVFMRCVANDHVHIVKKKILKEGIGITLPKKKLSWYHYFVALKILHRIAISVFEKKSKKLREAGKLKMQCIEEIGEWQIFKCDFRYMCYRFANWN